MTFKKGAQPPIPVLWVLMYTVMQQGCVQQSQNRGETNGTLNSGGKEDHYMTGWKYCVVEKGFAAPESNMEDLSQSFSCV